MARRTIDELFALTIPEIQNIFLEVMQDVVSRAMLDEMIKAIELGDAEALFRATGFTPAALGPILDRIEATYQESAEIAVDGWPKRIRTPGGLVVFRFDMRNPVVEEDLKNISSTFITSLTEEARQNVRSTLEQGMIRGENPRKTALDIVGRLNNKTKKREGGIIGLSQNQQRWVVSAERQLNQLDKKYFDLRLRDKRFDKTVRAAIESGKKLSAETVSKIMTAYKSKALAYRGEMIARTETLQSINRGDRAAYMEAIEEGVISRQAISKEWDDTRDLRERPSHRFLGRKYGKTKGIDFDEPFVTSMGARMMHPGDTTLGAPASEIINCRCRTRYSVDWRLNAGELDE